MALYIVAEGVSQTGGEPSRHAPRRAVQSPRRRPCFGAMRHYLPPPLRPWPRRPPRPLNVDPETARNRPKSGLDILMNKVLGRASSVFWAQVRMMVPVMVTSAFLNNTPIVALLIPILLSWSRRWVPCPVLRLPQLPIEPLPTPPNPCRPALAPLRRPNAAATCRPRSCSSPCLSRRCSVALAVSGPTCRARRQTPSPLPCPLPALRRACLARRVKAAGSLP